MNKFKKLFIIIIIFTLSTCCFLYKNSSNVKTLNKQNLTSEEKMYKQYYEVISLLTSEDFGGRLPGSIGNKKTVKMIETKFSSLDLKPLIGDNYLQEYNQSTFTNINASMNIFFPDGKSKKLHYGRDFLDRKVILNLNTHSSITDNIEDLNENTKFLLANENGSLSEYIENSIPEDTIILVKSNYFTKLNRLSDKYPIIQITEAVYDLLSNNSNCEIQMSLSTEKKNIVSNNVLGMIKGTTNNKAVVLSCHFDHVGTWGESLFRGAIDNASGTALFLNLTEDLSNFYKTTKPAYDIIFAAFNGEESGLQGSDYFVKNLSGEYENIYNINLDCIGIKGDDTLVLSGDNSMSMINSLKSWLEKESIDVNSIEGGFTSDHMSFTNAGFSGVNIGQYSVESIHTTDDNIDKIDFKYIDNIKKILYKILTSNLSDFMKENKEIKIANSLKDELKQKRLEESTKIKSSLTLGEYGVFDILGCKYFIEKNSITYDDFNEFKEHYPNLILNNTINNYKLKDISIDYYSPFDKSKKIEFMKSLELNKIYSIDIDTPVIIKNIILKYNTQKDDSYIELILNEGTIDSDNSKILTINKSDYILTYSDKTFNYLFSIGKNISINSNEYALTTQIKKPVVGSTNTLKEFVITITPSIQEDLLQLLESINFSQLTKNIINN
ncbi:M28 family metallopeptidase [Oceanirhabdus sp. W0125-5]|uniref:M28 family metallopeptidase n=1 Tax=Oceanirhabdus sp. W0125-5 TaxID=2999116 RepID=UPI0022F2AEFD|nr:M28 family metallopeptidase [Oceanirhabdus sp. W0125-5]WBW96894.1 M28 family metallopeptidase [Oceanirhabdus sp. W0125-5]